MKQRSAMEGSAAQLAPSTSGRRLRRPDGLCLVPVWSFVVVLCLSLFSSPCAGEAGSVLCPDGAQGALPCDGCGYYGDAGGSVHSWGSSLGDLELRNVCTGSGSFCFPSTLIGFLPQEDGCQRPTSESSTSSGHLAGISSEWRLGNVAAFRMCNGGIVSCSLVDTKSGIHAGFHTNHRVMAEDNLASCEPPLVPDAWMRTSSGLTADLDDHDEDVDPTLLDGSSLPFVEISPPLLDWGTNNLYSPSLAFLTVRNTNSDSILQVYEPFSTDPQFYAYDFDRLSLVPGESASIAFVFLPRLMGSSSAHLVLQTSFGGFIIQARGTAVDSLYKVETLVGFDISIDDKLNQNLSLYNPFDDVLYVEEVTAWISASGNKNHSAHVACSMEAFQQSSEKVDVFLNDSEWYTVKSGELGMPWVDIRPQRLWEVAPQSAQIILEMNLWPHMEGNIFGAICMKLQNSTRDRTDTVIVPLELKVHGRMTYNDLTGSVSVFFESLGPFEEKGSVFSLSLRNGASSVLTLVNISEVTESPNLFRVKFMEGLILFPGTVTRIALINYTPIDSQDVGPETPNVSLNCNLLVATNHTASPLIKIPCQDLVLAFLKYQPGSGIVASDGSYIGLISHQEKGESINARTGSLGNIVEESNCTKPKLLGAVEADELILNNWRSQGSTSETSVLKEHELLFPVVQIGSHFSKWISVRNPGEKPVVMQLVLNSGEIIDQCKSADDLHEHTFSSRFMETATMGTRVGFSVADSAITEALVHPSESVSFGPVIFRPSNRCMWTSSALIRNNLSGVEWLPLRAFGGSRSLVLSEGSEPRWKLDFNVDLPMTSNISSSGLLSHMETSSSSCSHRFSKEIHAKNTGELPLEVIKLKVSGTDCGLDGFMIHDCKGFALAPGESMRLVISYQADFSTGVVQRDLELAMATGMFVIPMKASVPTYMLKFCRESFSQAVHWKVSVLVLAAVSILLLVLIRMVPSSLFLGAEDCYDKVDNAMHTKSKTGKTFQLHHGTKSSRSVKEDEKPEANFVNEYPSCSNGHTDSAKRTQSKEKLGCRKDAKFSPPTSTAKSFEVPEKSDVSGTPQSGSLTIKIVKEKGRRRKRRAAGAGLAAKIEVSSSQSGNSTPSSPQSSNATPKQGWPFSPDSMDNPFSTVSEEQKHQRRNDNDISREARAQQAETHYDNTWLLSAREQPPVTKKPIVRPPLSSSASFPGQGWRAPGVAAPYLLAATSPIAPHARAPGSKLNNDKAIKLEENNVRGKEFTYDIWGDHFYDHLLGRPKEFTPKVLDASEGDSQSFFVSDPQSLMTMSSTRSVSLGHKLPSYDVTGLHQKD